MTMDNDTRGWIMTALSGAACVIGASIIYIDVFIRYIPRYRNFSIQDSNAFSTCSLSLSFGVMIYSALYKMLPSSKKNLIEGGFSEKASSWIMISCFLGGAVVIYIVVTICHRYMPSHVVDCDHSHGKEEEDEHEHGSHEHSHSSRPSRTRSSTYGTMEQVNGSHHLGNSEHSEHTQSSQIRSSQLSGTKPSRRPSLQNLRAVKSFLKGERPNCDSEHGTCYGDSDLCPKECFDKVASRKYSFGGRPAVSTRAATEVLPYGGERQRLLSLEEDRPLDLSRSDLTEPATESDNDPFDSAFHRQTQDDEEAQQPHHHHVPNNNFMSISLQTSIAIALHKIPEGFITFATNHASPNLGTAVFIALFVHNITEGFALAFPIYLAIQSRGKAIIWSFFLGGCSQPLGAGIAAIWFWWAGNGDKAPGEAVYGGMFAVTAGIMACVGCQIFAEAMGLTHRRGLCLCFAFLGMGILGISNALTVD